MEESISRIKNAIDEKTALDNQDNLISLDDKTGIDILGNMVQSNILSPNQDYYGDLHNHGHLLLAYIHDPNGYYKVKIISNARILRMHSYVLRKICYSGTVVAHGRRSDRFT